MRKSWQGLERFRQHSPKWTEERMWPNCYVYPVNGRELRIIASRDEGSGWEHVSVHAFDPIFKKNRTPSWDEMQFVKCLFWDNEETVLQLHPPSSQWVSFHDNVLHLWKPTGQEIELPPQILV